MSDLVRLDVDDASGVAWVVMNRPERRNALNRGLVRDLKEAFREADGDERVAAAVLAGSGPDFCAGADLAEIREAVEEGITANLADAESLGELFVQLRGLEMPVIAAVHGRALAGGSGLAAACDLVLASSEAAFGFPEVTIGFVPAMVMAILRRAVGEKHAFELVATGDRIDAERAREYGLVNRVYPAEDFDDRTEEFAAEMASNSATAMALTKKLLYQMDGQSFESAIQAGAEMNALARLTEDCQEGIARFLDE